MQIVMARGREIPVTTRKRCATLRQAAEALFVKPEPAPAKAAPRILEDVAVKQQAAVAKTATPSTAIAIADETEHQKVFRLVREGEFEDAARIAARLINSGNDDGFFIYIGTPGYQRAETWMAERVAHGRQSPGAGFETVTPERAQVLLLKNDGNRKVRVANLAVIMRDIASGRWEKNGETLIVSDDGLLNDGQHRNFAVLLTGRAIETAMAFGVTRESIVTIDTGAKRTGGDRLGFLDIKNYSRIAAIVALAYKIIEGRAATESEKVYFYRDHAEKLQVAGNVANNLPRGSSGAAFGAAAFIMLKAGLPEDRVSDFFAEIRGAKLPKRRSSPSTKIREALLARSFKASAEKQVCTIVDLYMKWVAGKSTGEIKVVDSLPASFVN